MAEALAVTGVIFSALEIAQRVYKIGKGYLDIVKDGKRLFYSVLIEVSTVKVTLECLQDLVETDPDGSTTIRHLLGDNGPIEGCHRALAELEGLLASQAPGLVPADKGVGDKSWQSRLRQATKAITWPATLETVQRLQREIGQYKSTMTMALQTDMAADIKKVKEGVDHLLETISESQLEATCGWLMTTNPWSRHHEATRKHEPHTSEWVFRTSEWMEWHARKRRFLWLHGIPGAGKTVLSSYLIKKLEAQHEDEPRTVVTYYYCYFGHSQDEVMPFLSWLLSQLCRKVCKVPANILRLRRTGHKPDEHDILDALQDVLRELEVVYIVIDAVDESKCRENLIDILLKLARDDSFCKIQLLAASREYQDLDDAFRPVAASLSLTQGEVEKDIRTYIRASLERRPAKTKSWSQVLIQDVEDTLAKQAKGMFQWAFCQIKRLERLPSYKEQEIRKALATLPKTLFETYERILLEIPEDDKKLARDTLLYLCGFRAHSRISSTAQHEGCRVLRKFQTARSYIYYELDSEAGMTAVEGSRVIAETCGCLVRDADYDLEFTHYTVSEFLFSEHLACHANSELRFFALDRGQVYKEYINRVIVVITKLQNEKMSDIKRLPDHVCKVAPDYTHDLFWPMVTLGKTVTFGPCHPNLRLPVDTEQQLLGLLCSEPDTLTSRFLPWSQLGHHRWLSMPSENILGMEDMKAFSILHGTPATNHDVKSVITLSLLSGQLFLKAVLEGKCIADLLEVKVSVDLPPTRSLHYAHFTDHTTDTNNADAACWETELTPRRTVTSNLISALEVYRQYLWLTHGYMGDPVVDLIQVLHSNHAGAVPETDMMIYYLVAGFDRQEPHGKYPLHTDEVLTRLLDHGADVNAAEYAMTPLQLAVERRNDLAVKALLEYKADPNGTGKAGGKLPKGAGICLRWCQASPLRIVRQAPHPLEDVYQDIALINLRKRDQINKTTIEKMLLDHGARDFDIEETTATQKIESPVKPSSEHMENVSVGVRDMTVS